MSVSQVHYLPLAPPFFFILVGLFLILLLLIQLGVLRYAYMRLGISSGAALLLLFASLIGSYFNIPVAYLPEHRVLAQQEIDFFGMRYVVPVVAQWPGTVIAVNVGGAVIPTMMSIYLLARHRLWVQAALATVVVAAVCYWLSRPLCWARAGSGHVTTAPPRRDMNSRRRMSPPKYTACGRHRDYHLA